MDASALLNLKRVQALETWLKTTNIKLTQVNAQRKYGGPPEGWDGPTPGAHCEVFISQIPRDTYEDLLIPLFSSVGPLWEFRLMMNFSGQNRGFAYAKYSSSGVAANAVRLLHGHELAPGIRLSVCHSTEKRHLCIEGLPSTIRQGHLLQVLHVLAEGVERVFLKTRPGIEGVSAVVGFSSHHAASMAKRILMEALKEQFAVTVSIKWESTGKPSSGKPSSASPSSGKPPPPRKPSKKLLASPLKQPRHILIPPQPSVLPAPPTNRPFIPPGFCRAVGGPTAPYSHTLPANPPSPVPPPRGI